MHYLWHQKDVHDKQAWNTWEKELIQKEPEVLAKYREELADEICYYEYLQYWFLKQWLKVKKYANERGIKIIGDIPIYVAFDSADAWMNPELFEFDEDMNPIEVAGCPPDGFTADGQLWGNPIYGWEYHKNRTLHGGSVVSNIAKYCMMWFELIISVVLMSITPFLTA